MAVCWYGDPAPESVRCHFVWDEEAEAVLLKPSKMNDSTWAFHILAYQIGTNGSVAALYLI